VVLRLFIQLQLQLRFATRFALAGE